MAMPALGRDVEQSILAAINAAAQANPDMPREGRHGARSTVRSTALAACVASDGGSDKTWTSRFDRVRARNPAQWRVAMAGLWVPSEPGPVPAVPREGVRRWLLTAAQDNTAVHAGFWANLQAYAAWLGAEVIVGGFTYQKGLFEDHAARSAVFAEAVRPFMAHEKLDFGSAVFCAEMNTLPTAARPLSSLETYTQSRYGVFPHAKIQLLSVPALAGAPAAILCTTGACTIENYVPKKAGLKAAFHHAIGATILEIDSEGRPFLRQLNATDDGSFQDLDVRVCGGRVSTGHRVEGITWGDLHREKADPEVARACFGVDLTTDAPDVAALPCSMLEVLRPRHQFFHDLLDFTSRNHHSRGNPHFRFRMVCEGTDSVEAAIRACARFLRLTARDWCKSVVVAANHNEAFPRWLREADGREDPVNSLYWHEANAACLRAIQAGERDFDVFRWATGQHDDRNLEDIVFTPRNGSYLICQEHGGIECALHGDQGPNGARGTPLNLTKVATRMNTGHTHQASILDGVYTAGLCGLLDMDYNEGPSSWSHSQIITYPSGKRTIVTLLDGKWRA